MIATVALRAPARRLGQQRERRLGIGAIRARRARVDRALEMRAELGQRRGDLAHGLVHRAPDVLARALGLGRGGPVAAAETDRAGQLAGDEVELLLGARRALVIRPVTGLLELLAQLVHARPIGRLGLRVQRRARTGRVVGPQLARARGAAPPRAGAPLAAATSSSTWISAPGCSSSTAR